MSVLTLYEGFGLEEEQEEIGSDITNQMQTRPHFSRVREPYGPEEA